MKRERFVDLFGIVYTEIPQVEVDQNVVHDRLGQCVDQWFVILLQELSYFK